jgi:hypothetical protein
MLAGFRINSLIGILPSEETSLLHHSCVRIYPSVRISRPEETIFLNDA